VTRSPYIPKIQTLWWLAENELLNPPAEPIGMELNLNQSSIGLFWLEINTWVG